MNKKQKFDIKYDYTISMLLGGGSETLIGGSEKVLKRSLKDSKNPNFNTKDLDVYYHDLPLGTFALEMYQAPEIDTIQNLVDKLYANVIDKNPTGTKVADTKLSLNALFNSNKNNATIRVLARVVSVWYAAVTDYYMNGKFGIPISQKDRAKLGEQFKEDVNALIETIFTTLKKKKSLRNNAEIRQFIQFNCVEVGAFLEEYSRYLANKKVFCIRCNLCDDYFLANSRNALYCADCKLLRKKNSKKIYAEKCSEGVHYKRQQIKYRFENFIHKGKAWKTLSEAERAKYQALRKEFVAKTAAMLRNYDQNASLDVEREIERFLREMDDKRFRLEFEFGG